MPKKNEPRPVGWRAAFAILAVPLGVSVAMFALTEVPGIDWGRQVFLLAVCLCAILLSALFLFVPSFRREIEASQPQEADLRAMALVAWLCLIGGAATTVWIGLGGLGENADDAPTAAPAPVDVAEAPADQLPSRPEPKVIPDPVQPPSVPVVPEVQSVSEAEAPSAPSMNARAILRELRALEREGRGMQALRRPGDLGECGDAMRTFQPQADALRTAANALEHPAAPFLSEGASHMRNCVSCLSSALEYCDLSARSIRDFEQRSR